MSDVFNEIKEEEKQRQQFIAERNEEIKRLKRMRTPGMKRKKELKEKAKKALKWVDSPGFKDFEDYLMDLTIEANINLRSLGLSGKSSKKIGDEVIRLSERINVIETIINEPKDLVKVLKD